MTRRPIECATGVDLDRAVADDRMSLADADAVRAFSRLLQALPPRPEDGRTYTREALVRMRQAYVDYGGHDDVIAHIDGLLGEEAREVRESVGECPEAADHDTRNNVCIHCGAEFDDPEEAD